VDALICLLADTIDREVIESAPSLKIIANYAVGYNNIDIEFARERRIWVTNTPDVLTEATADLTLALILACARRIVEGDGMVRAGQFSGWLPDLLLGMEMKGKTLGIAGMGRIGQAVARRARGFGLSIVYFNRARLDPSAEKELQVRYLPLPELLSTCDILSLHLPLTPETYHLVDGMALRRMKGGSILINTSRGPVVDEAELVRVLNSGHLRAAGLDVYEEEPRLFPGLTGLDNVVLLPHLGSATLETRTAMADLACENVRRVLAGSEPVTPVFPLH